MSDDVQNQEPKTYTQEEFDAMQSSLVTQKEKLLDETKAAKAERNTLREEREADRLKVEAAERDALAKAGKFEELLELKDKQYQDALEESKQYKSNIQQKDMQASITDIANEIAFKPELAKHLKRELETYAKHNGEQVTYEINGSPATREQVVLQVKKDNPDLVKGDGMSGGGASGSNKGSGALTGGNPWKRGENFNLTEQGRISQSDPQLAQRLMAEA